MLKYTKNVAVQMSTNKPSIDSVVLKITLDILKKYLKTWTFYVEAYGYTSMQSINIACAHADMNINSILGLLSFYFRFIYCIKINLY